MIGPKLAPIVFALTISLAAAGTEEADQKSISLTPIGTYASGIFDQGGAEIVAHDPRTQQLFVVNARAATVDVLSIKNPSRPSKIGQINVTPFGTVANSVAVHDGLIAVAGATDVSTFTGTVGTTGKTVEQLTISEMLANNIRPIDKILHVDLNAVGYNKVQKVEGLTLIDSETLAVINDNDFGVANILVNPQDGTFTLNYVPEPIQLGIIETRLDGLDASDVDNKINIRQWPVKGMYLSDGIASFKLGQQTYLVTANEGDAREYPGFTETVRIGSANVLLDPAVFPNGAALKIGANLGRLNITNTMGRNPVTGLYEQLFAFGTRSFSIWNTSGKLIFDSGDALERITAKAYPSNFNASNTNNTFDNRSDDKGPEPEGVVVGNISGKPYAFIVSSASAVWSFMISTIQRRQVLSNI
jgi:hypothetical protein